MICTLATDGFLLHEGYWPQRFLLVLALEGQFLLEGLYFPCFAHSTQTDQSCPFNYCRYRFSVDFVSADFASQCKLFTFHCCLLSCYVYTCRKTEKHVDGEHLENELAKIRAIADYQFGKNVGEKLFPENVRLEHSPRTGRIRFINLDGERLATLRPTDGLLSLSVKAAKSSLKTLLLPALFCHGEK